MKSIVHQAPRHAAALAAVVIVFGFVAESSAYAQRSRSRGRMMIPQKPAVIDSAPMIEPLNKALKLLSATDRDYDGHREKAINHINAAIHDMQVPKTSATATAKGKNKGNSAGEDDSADEKDSPSLSFAKAGTISPAESDANLRKALQTLFSVHHDLEDKASTKGRIHADAEVRIAISELSSAAKTLKTAPAPTAATAPAPAAGSSSFTTKPRR